MSSPFEKPTDKSPEITATRCSSKTDWPKVRAMDDEDIVFDEDSPEIPKGFWKGSQVTIQGRPATPAEIDELKRQLLAYIYRPRKVK